jgi:hypothetical protein
MVRPRLQMRAGAEKSTDTREIINRYCKLGITRSILRCADAIVTRSCTDTEHRPIRISRVGVDIILHDGIPYIDQSRDGNIATSLGPRFSGETERIGKIAMPISVSRLHTVDGAMIGRCGVSISRDVGPTG